MRRRAFDVLTSTVGLVLAVVLLIAGGLLMWGYSYDHSNVHNQLAQQDIVFPPKAAFAHPKAGSEITAAMIPSVSQYAGQQLLTGPQAEAYADHFIAIHLSELPYGGIYSKISTAARAEPTNTTLAALETTSFQGTTLRGLLLEAYGFSQIGTIMLYGSIASFILAVMMLGLVALGLRHAQGTAPGEEMLASERVRALAGDAGNGQKIPAGGVAPTPATNGELAGTPS
jgi:hypothetical protein